MRPEDLAAVNARVRAVADRIQPLLAPHEGLAKRNAHAHVWLGLKVIFGEAEIMLAYSPMKKSANFMELYSV